LSFGGGGGDDGVLVVVDVPDGVGVIVVSAGGVATGVPDPPWMGCGGTGVGVFVGCTFTHRRTRV
jgi:hypothetical protein